MNKDIFIRIGEVMQVNALSGLLIIDCSYKVVFVNDTFCRLWGLSVEQILHKRLVDFFAGKKRKFSGGYYGPLLETIETMQELEVREMQLTVPGSGRSSWFLVNTVILRDEQGQPEYAAGIYVPIDKFKALENKLDNLNMKIVNAFCKAIGVRDEYTMRHSEKVAELMVGFAEYLKLSSEDMTTACLAGMVHDIGKIGISELILNKQGSLTDAEFEVIKRHPAKGADILAEVEEFSGIADIVRHHHERYDGKGYPLGLKGKEISLVSRMLSLCDSYDAMTSIRCYCSPRTVRQALGEIQKYAGQQFDPELAQTFVQFIAQCEGEGALA